MYVCSSIMLICGENMKRIIRDFLVAIAALVLLLGIGVFSLMYYYRNTFPAFLWINGVYSTGKTIRELNSELVSRNPCEGIRVVDREGAELYIRAEDIDLTSDYTGDLKKYQQERGGANWWKDFFRSKALTAECEISFDKDKLRSVLENWEAFPEPDDIAVTIEKSDDGYILKDNASDFPLLDNICDAVAESIMNRENEIMLGGRGDLYYDAASSEQIHTREFFDKIEDIQNRNYVLNFEGQIITIDKETLSGFILRKEEFDELLQDAGKDTGSKNKNKEKVNPGKDLYVASGKLVEKDEIDELLKGFDNGFAVDDNDNPVISLSKVYDYAVYLSDTYDTEWFLNRYLNGLSDVIFINEKRSGKGELIDPDKEFDKLKDLFLTEIESEKDENILALLPGVKTYNASQLLGNTFIEVNMEKQELKYYVDSKLSMEMPVVTGNISRSRGTPAGIFDVYNKRYHTYLRGVNYVSYVNYWLGVNKGVGIHDANWRDEFGKEIYKTDGSHGCINCPEDKVSVLWEVVEIGTPVILYY